MFKILVGIDDAETSEIVRMAFKNFAGVTSYAVPPSSLVTLVEDQDEYHAVIADASRSSSREFDLLKAIRAANAKIEILAIAERIERDSLNRTKMDLNIFSFIPFPIEPFDLARRIHRLMKALEETHSKAMR